MPAPSGARRTLLALLVGAAVLPGSTGAGAAAPVATAAPARPVVAPVTTAHVPAAATALAPARPPAAAPLVGAASLVGAAAPRERPVALGPAVPAALSRTTAAAAASGTPRDAVRLPVSTAPAEALLRRQACRPSAGCRPIGKRRWLSGPSTALPSPLPSPLPVLPPVLPPVPAVVPAPVPTAVPTALPTELPSVLPRVVPARSTLGAWAFRSGEVDELSRIDAYGYLVLNAWEGQKAAALKAAHPGLQVLVYKDASSTRSYAVRNGVDDARLPTGVGFRQAETQHPEWFLLDTTGARMEWPYDSHWWMDVADPSYQQAWAGSVEAELTAGPWDGVWIDNVMASPEWYLGDRTIAKHPTRSSFEAATESFLRAVAPRLKATGALVIGNVSDASPQVWDRWTGLMSGGNHEHSFSWNDGTLYGGLDWLGRVEEIERTQAAGRVHLAMTEALSTDVRALTYARASWLMAWSGRSSSVQMVLMKDTRDAWSDLFATDLGAPLGARTDVGGAWRRHFTGGTALVNPTTSTLTVALAAPMTDQTGRRLSSVVLAPRTASLLTP